MADTNLTATKKKIAGEIAQDSGGMPTVDQMLDISKEFLKAAADSMAADTTAATKFWTNPFDFPVEIMSGIISPNAGLTAHDTNYAQVQVLTDNAADSAPAVALQWDTTLTGGGTGTWATDIVEANTTRTVANCTVLPGANVFFAIAKQGSGVVVPIHTVAIKLRRK